MPSVRLKPKVNDLLLAFSSVFFPFLLFSFLRYQTNTSTAEQDKAALNQIIESLRASLSQSDQIAKEVFLLRYTKCHSSICAQQLNFHSLRKLRSIRFACVVWNRFLHFAHCDINSCSLRSRNQFPLHELMSQDARIEFALHSCARIDFEVHKWSILATCEIKSNPAVCIAKSTRACAVKNFT